MNGTGSAKARSQRPPIMSAPVRRSAWVVPTGLVLLSLIPILAGALRLTELSSGAAVTADNERFFGSPIPVVIHIVSATVFAMLGAFQFATSPAGARSRWHRKSGRVVVPAGLFAALSGLWMTVFYSLPPNDGPLLLWFRLDFGVAMVVSIALGIRAIVQRRFARHGAWMTRAYAIGVAAGTQAIVLTAVELIAGPPDVTWRALLMGASWLLNLAIAEYIIQRRAFVGRRNALT